MVLAPRDWPLVALLRLHPDWQLIGEDRKVKENEAFLFARRVPLTPPIEARTLDIPHRRWED